MAHSGGRLAIPFLIIDRPRRYIQLALGPRLRLLVLLSRERLAFWRPGALFVGYGGDTVIVRAGPFVAYWRRA